MAPEAVQPMLVQRVDDLLVTLEVRPNRPGQNLFRIRTVDTKNPTVITRFSVRLRLNPAEPAQATAEGRLVAAAEDNSLQTYQVTSDALNLAGTWPIEVTVQRQGEAERVAAFRWTMPPGELQPTVLSKYPLAKPLMTAALVLLLLCSVVAGGLGWLSVQRRQPAQERRAVGQPPVIESA